jgi:hypothetical protein
MDISQYVTNEKKKEISVSEGFLHLEQVHLWLLPSAVEFSTPDRSSFQCILTSATLQVPSPGLQL